MPALAALSRNIRTLRSYKKLSQGDLAEKVGISRQHLSQIEAGRTSPSLEVTEAIAKHLKISVSSLFETHFTLPKEERAAA